MSDNFDMKQFLFEGNMLTLLCPIKDRPEYTKRFISYLISASCPFNVVIADGSLNADLNETVEMAISHGLKLNYVRYPHDKTWSDFIDKMCDALDNIQTPYTALVSDDDFYDFNEMSNGVNFLEENPKFQSYAGEIIDFSVVGGDSKCVHGELVISEEGRHCAGRYKSDQKVEDDDVIVRLKRYADVSPYEYIHHTLTLRDIFNAAKKSKVKDYRHLLPIMKWITLICGSVYYSSIPFTLRQDNTPFSGGDEMIKEYPTDLHFCSDKKNFQTELDILNLMVRYASSSEPDVSEADIKVALQTNLLTRYQKVISSSLHNAINEDALPRGYLLPKFFKKINTFLRSHLRKISFLRKIKNILDYLKYKHKHNLSLDIDFVSDSFIKKVYSVVSNKN